jgi:hypothetical protein
MGPVMKNASQCSVMELYRISPHMSQLECDDLAVFGDRRRNGRLPLLICSPRGKLSQLRHLTQW